MRTGRQTLFQSTLPARGATRQIVDVCRIPQISIHAPRTGSDGRGRQHQLIICLFQSTLPARGATNSAASLPDVRFNFNPRSPHGERLQPYQCKLFPTFISIHAPRTGSDYRAKATAARMKHFNPRSPHGERLPSRWRAWRRQTHFNPRSPHGERLRKVTILSIRIIDFAQKVYHKTVLLRISLAENAVILPEKPRNPVRTSLQKAGGLRFARAIRAAHPYSISSPSGA